MSAGGSSNAGSGQAGRAGAAPGGMGGAFNGGNGGGGGAQGAQAGAPQAGSAGASQSGAGGAAGGAGVGGIAGNGGAAPTDGVGFFNTYCFDCHGTQGTGTTLAPEIQHPVRDYSTWVVRHGLPGVAFREPMESVGPEVIPDQMLEAIWDYLDEPPQPTTGQALYHDYCANCHGADGSGGPTDRPIVDELDKLKMQVSEGAHAGEFDMRHEYMPALSPSRLSNAEVDLIYRYVEGL